MRLAVSLSAGIVFALIFYMVFIQVFYEKLVIEQKIDKYLDGREVILNENIEEFTENNVQNRKIKKKSPLTKKLARAGIRVSFPRFMFLQLLISIVVILLGYFVKMGIASIIGILFIWYVLTIVLISHKTKKRKQKFNHQLPEFIVLVVSSLKVGHSLTQAMKTAASSAPSPIKEEFEILIKTLNYGVNLKDALDDMYSRIESEELAIMSNAIIIQKEVGGNIIRMLEIIHKTIKEREALDRKITTLTAQGRMSGMVIGLMPIVIMISILFITPDYIMPLFTTTYGRLGLILGVFLELTGLMLIKKIVEVEV